MNGAAHAYVFWFVVVLAIVFVIGLVLLHATFSAAGHIARQRTRKAREARTWRKH